jgi:Fe-S cluster assembly iron-binding protein IscA
LTDAAVTALEDSLGPGAVRRDDHPLRVAVEGDPASGYSYYFGFTEDPNEPQYKIDNQRDIIQVVKGFPVVVRREHLQYLTGTTIDYVISPTEGAGFKFDNPRGTLASQVTGPHR